MDFVSSILTEQTCGEACWEAREEICRCSCGGKNHGCLREKNSKQPNRSAKIDGFPYVLKAVGCVKDIMSAAREINNAAGTRETIKISDTRAYQYPWTEKDKGAPARVKKATDAQRHYWDELSAWAEDNLSNTYVAPPYLLWVKVESIQVAAVNQC